MANTVNPPPQLQIPKQFTTDPQTLAFFDQQRTILFQLWQKLGGNQDPLTSLSRTNNQVYGVYSQWVQRQLDGLPQFTIDTSGFTCDTARITTDKVFA